MKPKIVYPTFIVHLPISKIDVKMRVMNLREEKILLTAQESKNVLDLMNAMFLCLDNCILESEIYIKKLPFVELQYLYLNLRGNSVGNVSKLLIPDEDETWRKYEVNVDINDIALQYFEEINLNIEFDLQNGMIMRYPTFDDAYKLNTITDEKERLFAFIGICVEKIYDSENVYERNQFTNDEIIEYINDLPSTYYDRIKTFINDLPHIEYTVKYKTFKEENRKLVLKTLENFLQ